MEAIEKLEEEKTQTNKLGINLQHKQKQKRK